MRALRAMLRRLIPAQEPTQTLTRVTRLAAPRVAAGQPVAAAARAVVERPAARPARAARPVAPPVPPVPALEQGPWEPRRARGVAARAAEAMVLAQTMAPARVALLAP